MSSIMTSFALDGLLWWKYKSIGIPPVLQAYCIVVCISIRFLSCVVIFLVILVFRLLIFRRIYRFISCFSLSVNVLNFFSAQSGASYRLCVACRPINKSLCVTGMSFICVCADNDWSSASRRRCCCLRDFIAFSASFSRLMSSAMYSLTRSEIRRLTSGIGPDAFCVTALCRSLASSAYCETSVVCLFT